MIRLNTDPTKRQLRSFALLWWPLFCAVVGIALWRFDLQTAAQAVLGVGLLVAVLGAAVPSWIRPVFVALLLITYPIGWVISHIVLLLAYYVVLTPVGLGLRLFGKDPLFPDGRRLDKGRSMEQTRWRRWQAPESRTRYFSQY